jgi:hypothetical protein
MNDLIKRLERERDRAIASGFRTNEENGTLRDLIKLLRPSNRGPDCWCYPSRDTEDYGHSETCKAVCAAMALGKKESEE